MINQEKKEFTVGGIAFGICAILLLFVHKLNPQNIDKNVYQINASFKKADGIYEGSEVRLGGIKVGYVKSASINKYFSALISMEIDKSIKLPDDSNASIETDGIFGSKHIEISPGGSEDYIQNDGFIEYTQDSLIIEELLDKIIAIGKSNKNKQNTDKSETGE